MRFLTATAAIVISAVLAAAPSQAQETTRVVAPGEVITTGGAGQQVLLRDQSAITVGPDAQVKIGRFTGGAQGVSTAGGAGGSTVEVAKGAFRFVTGTGAPASYQIKTPLATIGIRGTVIEGYVDPRIEILILVEGAMQVCTTAGTCQTVLNAGQYVIVLPGGAVSPPATWPGPMLDINALVDFVRTRMQSLMERGGDVLPRWRELNDALDGRGLGTRCAAQPPICVIGPSPLFIVTCTPQPPICH